MTSYSVNNGVIYKDGQPFFLHMMYFEGEIASSNYPRIRSFLSARSDATAFTDIGINTVFSPIRIDTSYTTSLLNDLNAQGLGLINEYDGSGWDEFVTFASHDAYVGALASYPRKETVLLVGGSTTNEVRNCHCDDIGNPMSRGTSTAGYSNGRPTVRWGAGTSDWVANPYTVSGATYTHNRAYGNKSPTNAKWAWARHKNDWGANTKLVYGTGYKWHNDTGVLSAYTEIGTTGSGNPVLGLRSYAGVFDVVGFQVYGVKLNNSDPNSFGRPYIGMKTLVPYLYQNGILTCCPVAILATYQGDWDMPLAPDIRNQFYQAIIGGARGIVYYTMGGDYTTNLRTSPADRRLEIGQCWKELQLKALALDGVTRIGEKYLDHILKGTHTIHTTSATGTTTLNDVEPPYTSASNVICASWTYQNSRLILVANRDRRSTSTATSVTINLTTGTRPDGGTHDSRLNYNLYYGGIKALPSGFTFSLTSNTTLNINSLAPNSVYLFQTTLTPSGGGAPPVTGFTNRSVIYVSSGNKASANTNAQTDIGNAADNLTWDKKAYTADNRGRPDTWAGSTAYALNDQVKTTANRWYVCETAGTSSGTEPTHTSGTATDGSVTWRYLGTVTTSDFYLADGVLTDAQIDAVMARSYTPAIRHFRFNQEENGPLIASTARYGTGRLGQTVSLATMNKIIGDEKFAPGDYGTSIVWWDFGASDLVLNAAGDRAGSGENIATVNPLAGAAVLAQATDASRPSLEINQLNGKNVVSYIGTDNNKLLTTSTRSLIKNVSGITLVCVFRCTPTAGVNQRLFTHNNNGGYSRCVLMIDANSKIFVGGRSTDLVGEAFTSISTTSAVVADTWYIVVATMDYSTKAGVIYVNNVSDATGNICGTAGTVVNTDANSDPIVGRDAGAAYDFVGSMACFGIYSGLLTQEQRTGLYHRLKRFYSL